VLAVTPAPNRLPSRKRPETYSHGYRIGGVPCQLEKTNVRFPSAEFPILINVRIIPPPMPDETKTALLALEDGTVFTGKSFGSTGTTEGELVFNTSMTGYQEILTDPSYKGQIVTMTYPLIGNYGVNLQDVESKKPHVAGFVVKELSPIYSNYRANLSLDEYLKQNKIIGIQGIDTRALTRRLRMTGAMRSILSTEILDPAELVNRAKHAAQMAGADWVQAVKPDVAYNWTENQGAWQLGKVEHGDGLHVVALDCGAKNNILRHLVQRGCKVTVLPPDVCAEEILKLKPDGLFISNGPGDPAVLDYAIKPIKAVLDKLPIFGICLGHQLLGRAVGADTYKLKFGHRGGNQPVKNLDTGRVEITSQNHGFAVDRKSLEANGGIVTHINLNDNTVEGFRHGKLPVFCVQYHPEASPGPHDAGYLFDAFIEMMKTKKAPTAKRLAELQALR
jgi:carbamoyl-phosphate synthase small subunit